MENPLGVHAALSRHCQSPSCEIDFTCRMCVWVDAENAAEFQTALVPSPIQIQSPGIGIDFHGHPMLGAGSQNCIDIDVVSWPAQELPSSQMSKECREWIGNCTQDPLRLRGAIFAELTMHAGHDKIETCEHFIRVIKRPVRQNVRLNSLKNLKLVSVFGIQLIDELILDDNLLDAKPASVMSRFRVVGDTKIGVAAFARRFGHLPQSIDAVGRRGVGMQDAADVFGSKELRAPRFSGRSEVHTNL